MIFEQMSFVHLSGHERWCFLSCGIQPVSPSELSRCITSQFFEGCRKMLRRIKAGFKSDLCKIDVWFLQHSYRLRYTDIDQVVEGRKAGITFYLFRERRCTQSKQGRHFFNRPLM